MLHSYQDDQCSILYGVAVCSSGSGVHLFNRFGLPQLDAIQAGRVMGVASSSVPVCSNRQSMDPSVPSLLVVVSGFDARENPG